MKEELVKIVGTENVFDDPETLERYSKDESFVLPIKPRLVVKPKGGEIPEKIFEEVQAIVRWANDTKTPLVPVSSGPPHFWGDTLPSVGGTVIVDLSRMKRVIRVDRRNRIAMIEPGVTFSELVPELEKEGLKPYMPLVPRSSKSVVASVLEREPITMPNDHWEVQDPLACIEVVFGTGDVFRTGSAAGPGTLEEQWALKRAQMRSMGPSQTDYQKVVQGAQGTMGIVTWITMKCSELPPVKRAFLIPCERVEPLIDFTYRLLRARLGDECLILNNHNLACILADGGDIAALRETLPPWVLFVSLEGVGILPEKRVEYQERDLMDIAQRFALTPRIAVPGAAAEEVSQVLSRPSREPYWKLRFKGGCHGIFFLTTLDRTPEFINAMYTLASSHRYPSSDIGVYIQPTVQGCNCHLEFNLAYDPARTLEVEKVKRLITEGSRVLANIGAYFSRPYGPWADIAYGRATETVVVLRKVKGVFDPNNIMNPGKLCF